ncbi:hypothetical protein ACNKHN_15440 [Shigella flexneri]
MGDRQFTTPLLLETIRGRFQRRRHINLVDWVDAIGSASDHLTAHCW